jgi:hypothetical protein
MGAFNFKAFGVGIGIVALVLVLIVVIARMSRSPVSSDPGNTPPPHGERPTEGSIVAARAKAICSDTEKGYEEVGKWQSRGDNEEVARALLRYGGVIVAAGESLKVLERGFLKHRVRVVRTGHECWVTRAAIDP